MRLLLVLLLTSLFGQQPLRLVANLPAYRLDAFVGDSVVKTIAIAPGMPRYRTPRGTFELTRIEWNPWWIPPKSPWAAKEKITRPGPNNPMGKVKLNFSPLYFVHGSPFEQSIGTAASHGCIRAKNADAIELARLVHQFGSPSLTAGDIDGFAADTATREITLENPVPVELRYDLVEVIGRRVYVYRDIYGLATRSLRDETYAVLAAQSIDTLTLDPSRVRRFVRSVPRAGRSIAIDSLIQRTRQ
jgi:murein L,D-transpeptidase YcbB/YkuD